MSLPLYPFDKITKKAGIKRISKDATEELRDAVEEIGAEIAEKAVRISRHAGRRTVMEDDIKFFAKSKKE